jgi:hypothetical protein
MVTTLLFAPARTCTPGLASAQNSTVVDRADSGSETDRVGETADDNALIVVDQRPAAGQ